MGVRISWLILARKADLSLSLSSAFSLAINNSRIVDFRHFMQRQNGSFVSIMMPKHYDMVF